MIVKLDNSNERIAGQIFIVFQSSYKVEAKIIGTRNFPPLLRKIKDIVSSKSLFYGFYETANLAGVIEITVQGKNLRIDSLTVSPDYFKKGIASKLISYALALFKITEAVVETAVANAPAINLYKKHGFVEFKRWTPSHGIKKLAMSVKKTL